MYRFCSFSTYFDKVHLSAYMYQEDLGVYLHSLSYDKLVEIFAALKATCKPKGQAFLEIPEVSPEKVAQPYRKAQFLAQKRMAAQIKKNGQANTHCVEEANPPNDTEFESKAEAPKRKAAAEKPNAVKPKKPKTAKKDGKNVRKPSDGPMQAAMKKYITEQRAHGCSYQEALKSWKFSSERAEIVASVDLQEAKRRRYL